MLEGNGARGKYCSLPNRLKTLPRRPSRPEWKGSPAYNEAIGAALGIVGQEQTGPDFATVQPNINAVIQGTNVFVDWNWGGFSAFLDICELAATAKASSPSRSTPPPATSTPSPSPPRP